MRTAKRQFELRVNLDLERSVERASIKIAAQSTPVPAYRSPLKPKLPGGK